MAKAPRRESPGQPTKYKPEFCQELIEHMAEGFTFASFAGRVAVTRQTLNNWKKQNKEFKEAHAIGKACHQYFWEKTGIDGLYTETTLEGKSKTTRSLNATVYCAIMNHGPWRDYDRKQKKKDQGDDSASVVAELAAQFIQIMKGGKA